MMKKLIKRSWQSKSEPAILKNLATNKIQLTDTILKDMNGALKDLLKNKVSRETSL